MTLRKVPAATPDRLFDRLRSNEPGNTIRREFLAVAHERIGAVLHEQGDLPGALERYQASLAIMERLAKADPGNAVWQGFLAVSHDRIGIVLQAQGNLPEALESYRSALAIAERLAKAEPGNVRWQSLHSVSLGGSGRCSRRWAISPEHWRATRRRSPSTSG
jgi:tetratricopeptide (TPR) repeat protein